VKKEQISAHPREPSGLYFFDEEFTTCRLTLSLRVSAVIMAAFTSESLQRSSPSLSAQNALQKVP
jgi:hypothetical protein